MLEEWLTQQERAQAGKFGIIDVTELCPPSNELLDQLAREVVLAHGSPEKIRHDLLLLLTDLHKHELYILEKWVGESLLAEEQHAERSLVAKYLDREVLPDGIQTRVGNLGEVLAANLLIDFEGFAVVIYKLRYREKKDWAPRLTDLCLVKKSPDTAQPMVCYGEVKTNSSGCDRQLGVKGHDSLRKDDALADPEILRFASTLLFEMQRYEQAALISEIELGKVVADKRHDLFLVHERAHWSEEIIKNLEACDLDARLVDFSVKVVLIADLRHIIDEVYDRTWRSARSLTDE